MDMVDVIEVDIKPPHTIRVLARGYSEGNAEAFIKIAVMRRGVENSFYTTCRPGKYQDGDVRLQT